jgi:hypothetical protein
MANDVANKGCMPTIVTLQAEIQAMKIAQGNTQSNEAKAKARAEQYTWMIITPKEGKAKSRR